MSLRLEMLQVARLAPTLLGDSSALIRDFLLGELNDDGGFRGRDGASDLYYTVFGVDSLTALQVDLPAARLAGFIDRFTLDEIEALDLVHAACLARCRAALADGASHSISVDRLQARIAACRSGDGGFGHNPQSESGTVYGCFLALGAQQDLGVDLEDVDHAVAFINSMRTADGGYGNAPGITAGSTPATAAAVAFLRNTGRPAPDGVADWLALRLHAQGGFVATPGAPMPDLLSTATALHALDGLLYPVAPFKEPCLDFIDTLWTNQGSFYGTWGETELDSEYTFYGLLALGHLSL